jgi:hypothetical protein
MGMLNAEVNRERDIVTVNAVDELLRFDAEEGEMVRNCASRTTRAERGSATPASLAA